MKILTALLLLGLLLAGCEYSLPAVDSGSFELHSLVTGTDEVTTGPLAASQIKALVDWLRPRRTGWTFRVEDTAPGLLVHLKNAGKPVVAVNIHDREIKAGDRFLAITPGEHAELIAILSLKESAPSH